MHIRLTVNSTPFTARLEENASARALAALLPAAWTLRELNGNEKYIYLPDALPAAPKRPGRIHAGDLMLYGTDCVVLFYKTFATPYRYTPLGRLENPAGLALAAGPASARVVLERPD